MKECGWILVVNFVYLANSIAIVDCQNSLIAFATAFATAFFAFCCLYTSGFDYSNFNV